VRCNGLGLYFFTIFAFLFYFFLVVVILFWKNVWFSIPIHTGYYIAPHCPAILRFTVRCHSTSGWHFFAAIQNYKSFL
jgi:hypothetical protein